MTHLVRFLDSGPKGVWSNIRMENNNPCWIGFAQTGVRVKKSKVGMFGKTLYEKNASDSANTALALSKLYGDDLTPSEMRHPLLKAFTNAVLHCSNLEEVISILNDEYPEEGFEEIGRFLKTE